MMDSYEFQCVNYGDSGDQTMPFGWRCLRKVFEDGGVGEWRFARDERKLALAREAYEEAGYLARSQCGKVSLLMDQSLGMCAVFLEQLDYIQGAGEAEKARILTLLSHADSFTFTLEHGGSLGLDLSYRAFCKIEA